MPRKAPTKDVATLVKELSVRLTAVEKDVLLLADRVTELEDENANLKKASPSKGVVIVGEVARKPKMERSTGNVEDFGISSSHPIHGGTRWHKVCADKNCNVESCRRYCRKCDDETKERSAIKCYFMNIFLENLFSTNSFAVLKYINAVFAMKVPSPSFFVAVYTSQCAN